MFVCVCVCVCVSVSVCVCVCVNVHSELGIRQSDNRGRTGWVLMDDTVLLASTRKRIIEKFEVLMKFCEKIWNGSKRAEDANDANQRSSS